MASVDTQQHEESLTATEAVNQVAEESKPQDDETKEPSKPSEEEPEAANNNHQEETQEEEKPKQATSKSKPAPVSFQPGQIVLGKVKGYSPWPGMILREDQVPAEVLNQKPKPSSRRRKSGAGSEDNESEFAWPIRFFIDYSYMWGTRPDLKLLDEGDIEKFLSNSKGRRDKTLVEAYRVAKDPPEIDEFGLQAPPAVAAAEEEQVEEEEEGAPPPDSSKKQSRNNGSSKKRKSTAGGEGAPKTSRRKTTENGKKAGSPKPPKMSEEDIKKEKAKQVLFLRHKLQRGFLTKDKPPVSEEMETMDKLFTSLENFQGLEPEMIKETKINKVLKGIFKLPEIPLDDEYHFKDRSQKLLDEWNKWIGVKKEESEQPQTEGDEADGTAEPKSESDDVKPNGDDEAAAVEDSESTPAKTEQQHAEPESKQESDPESKPESKPESEPAAPEQQPQQEAY